MKFLIGIALIYFYFSFSFSFKPIESTRIINTNETIEYHLIGCFDSTNGSISSTPFFLLQLNEINETCYQIEKSLRNETQTYNYISPSRDDGVQIEIPIESCSMDFPQINLSFCDDDEETIHSNQTEFSTESYRSFDSSEETNDQSDEDQTHSTSQHTFHWNFLQNENENPTTELTTNDMTTMTTTTTTTTTTTKKITKKLLTTKAKTTTETTTTTTTTTSADPPKKSPGKGKGAKPK